MAKSSTKINAIGAAPGAAVGRATCWHKRDDAVVRTISPEQVAAEQARLRIAMEQAKQDIHTTYEQASRELPPGEAAIFEAHMYMIEDPTLLIDIEGCMAAELVNAEQAVQQIMEGHARNFEQLEDEYFRQRASDIREIKRRILSRLTGQAEKADVHGPSVLVADDLGPGEVINLKKNQVLAIITQQGGKTSHIAIVARALGIPCVVGAQGILSMLQQDDIVAVDGDEGVVIVQPAEEEQRLFADRTRVAKEYSAALESLIQLPSVTQDGKSIELWANIGQPEETAGALKAGAQGIGLFRTEFLFMDKAALPGEDEQERVYRQVLSAMQGRPVVIRTLDIGADKRLSYLPMPAEENPFLGVRGIRLCLKEQNLFMSQLRALLRASTAGNLWIMFPMITVLSEVVECKALFQTVREEVLRSGISVAENIKLGIMVETPAVALMADRFAKEVDFFSIGTNDLIQYTMAADRQNAALSYLNDPLNPAVLALIAATVRAAKDNHIPVGMCGEMAGNPTFTEYLVGLGLDELSMSPGSLLKVKEKLRSVHSQLAAEKAAGLMVGRDQ